MRPFPCLLATAGLMVCLSSAQAAEYSRRTLPQRSTARVMPGEFERQQGVILGWERDDRTVQRAVVDIAMHVWDRLPVVMLIEQSGDEYHARRALEHAGVPRTSVRFVVTDFDSIWTRDYGPTVVRRANGTSTLVDAEYERSIRPKDDAVPQVVGNSLQMRTTSVPLRIEGGNLLSNGEGVCITTSKVLKDNLKHGYRAEDIARLVKEHYGARELVILEPLKGESTGHVDMFATFVGKNTVVVGAYHPRDDAENAEILNRNADRLSRVMTSRGPLKVVRIAMPPKDRQVWRTYTNVFFANGTLLVPIYPGADPVGRTRAFALYRQLLPGWKIVGVDCQTLITLGGALHCVTMNLATVSQLPKSSQDQLASDRSLPPRKKPYSTGSYYPGKQTVQSNPFGSSRPQQQRYKVFGSDDDIPERYDDRRNSGYSSVPPLRNRETRIRP